MKRSTQITFIDRDNVVRGIYWGEREIPHDTFIEGIDFIFGHHPDDTEAVAALRAATRLAASRAFIEGEITKEAFKANLDLWDAEFAAESSVH